MFEDRSDGRIASPLRRSAGLPLALGEAEQGLEQRKPVALLTACETRQA
jgi:hypothetical protein